MERAQNQSQFFFSKKTQRYIKSLQNIRQTTNIVPDTNPYLFANPGIENKWIRGDYIIRMLAKKCGAKHPVLLTSTKFRKHIATTLQLMNMGADEMEQVATFMGHTKKTHAQFYRLPQDIYQTAKVVKVLLLLEKGKGKEFHGKNLEEINLDKDYYDSDVSCEEDKNEVDNTTEKRKRRLIDDTDITNEIEEQIGDEEICKMDKKGDNVGEEKAKINNIEDLKRKNQ
ncbi:hypothetical protein NQ314_010494 [Rhamnusium bicolor]|uniref:Tyr recombinase domain-containing protein n=1 Tax=Rhamnusium bicolor TaxID=1586634 RepID=A0AAV8XRL4_9CUCU|nr:hypothetical protein NQ314_010494 [Rhamnusium bicolor]